MGRVLIIAFAAVIGAIGTWFFVPTAHFQMGAANMAERPDAVDPPKAMMSNEDRRERAERLIGKPLKYITPTVIRDEAWYTEQGKDVIERSMDECYLLLEYNQYAHEDAHAGEPALSDGGWAEEGLAIPLPTRQQSANCVRVYRAYFAMHGKKFEF